MEGMGSKLRAARMQWQLTLREVEERSIRLAEEWGNPAYRISASWLDRVEREDRVLSATKLIVLAVVYGLTAEKLLALCSPAGANPELLDQTSSPNATLLLKDGPLEEHAKLWLPDKIVTDPPPEATMLLPAEVHGVMRETEDLSQRARLLCDHLSGMTDAYALRSYKRLFDPDYGSISELI